MCSATFISKCKTHSVYLRSNCLSLLNIYILIGNIIILFIFKLLKVRSRRVFYSEFYPILDVKVDLESNFLRHTFVTT